MRATMNTFYNAFDTERMEDWGSGADDFRTPFQVDRDRVLAYPCVSQTAEQDTGVLEWRV